MEKKEILLRSILTAATLLLLLLLVWQCLDIFLTGNSPANLDENGLYIQPVYRSDDVITRLSSLGIWAVIYLVLLVATWVVIPVERRNPHLLPMEPDNRLRLLKKKYPLLPDNARVEETFRRKIQLSTGAVVMLCTVMSLTFLLNRNHFMSWDLEMVMGQMLANTLPWVIAAFLSVIAASFVCRRSIEREIRLLKGIPGSKEPAAVTGPSFLTPVRMILYFLAVILILTGIQNGGMRDVLVKAINICTECIGLG